MAALCSIHTPALLALGIIDRYTPLAPLDKDNKTCDGNRHNEQEDSCQRVQFAGTHQFQRSANSAGQASNNTRKNNHRYAVADATLGYLFTQPHQKHGTCNQRDRCGKYKAKTRGYHQRICPNRLGLQRS